MDGLGEDPESSRNKFCSELYDAAYTGKLDLFQRLALKHAENEGIGVGKAIGELVDGDGKLALHVAAGGTLDVCKYLIETLKLDVDAKDYYGKTPLYYACSKGKLAIVTYLLENGANADASNDKNYTPLHNAAKTGDTKIITLLLARGARIDVVSRPGTALQEAAAGGHRDAVKVLLDHGANPNVGMSEGNVDRPLISAIYAKSRECVELLLQAGADPNAVSYGNTPLVAAAMDGCADVITRLLEAGADPNYKMNAGLTALEIAAARKNYEVVGILFPVTSRNPTYPDWSIAGLLRHVDSELHVDSETSDAINMQREVHTKEKFNQAKSKGKDAFQGEQYLMAANWFREAWLLSPEDPAVLSNMSACFARLGDGINALDYATKCVHERPEWPMAYYRLGAALNIQKRYNDAAAAFNKGLTLDPGNKELKDAYMKALVATFNFYQSGKR